MFWARWKSARALGLHGVNVVYQYYCLHSLNATATTKLLQHVRRPSPASTCHHNRSTWRTGRVELSRRRIVSITHYWSVSIIERVHGPARTHTLPGVSFHYSRHVIQWPPSDLVRHRVANWQLLIAEMQFRFKVSHFSLDKWPALPKVISIIIQVATVLVPRCRGHRAQIVNNLKRYLQGTLKT